MLVQGNIWFPNILVYCHCKRDLRARDHNKQPINFAVASLSCQQLIKPALCSQTKASSDNIVPHCQHTSSLSFAHLTAQPETNSKLTPSIQPKRFPSSSFPPIRSSRMTVSTPDTRVSLPPDRFYVRAISFPSTIRSRSICAGQGPPSFASPLNATLARPEREGHEHIPKIPDITLNEERHSVRTIETLVALQRAGRLQRIHTRTHTRTPNQGDERNACVFSDVPGGKGLVEGRSGVAFCSTLVMSDARHSRGMEPVPLGNGQIGCFRAWEPVLLSP